MPRIRGTVTAMTALLSRLIQHLDVLRRRVLLHRRALAACFAAVAVYAAVQAAAAPPAPTRTVWTATHAVPAGTVLARSDLARTPHLAGHVPDGAVGAPARVIGHIVAAPLVRGQVITRGAVVHDHWPNARPGDVAVPVRLTDPGVASLVRPGDRVDLVAADPQGGSAASVLVHDATVLAVPRPSAERVAGALPGRLVVLSLPGALSDTVVAHSAMSFLTVTWSR